jgi:hypothetical protein
MVITLRAEFGLIAGIYVGLVLFGIAFNKLTAWMECKGYLEGFTSLWVSLGVLITLAPFSLISLPFALIVVGGFMASGAWMIGGSISRYLVNRERARREIAELRAHGDKTERMA